MDSDKLLNLAVSLGCRLAESGAEISRVEESVYRLLNGPTAASGRPGVRHPQLSDRQPDGGGRPPPDPDAAHRRPRHGHRAAGGLQRPEPAALPDRAAPGGGPGHGGPAAGLLPPPPPGAVLLGYAAAPAFFCPLFGGGLWDASAPFSAAWRWGACLLFGGRWLGRNGFLRTLVCSGVASLLSLLLVRAGLGAMWTW